jgi:hypothetical protein
MTKMLEGLRFVACKEGHFSEERFNNAVRRVVETNLEPPPFSDISEYDCWEKTVVAEVCAAFRSELR